MKKLRILILATLAALLTGCRTFSLTRSPDGTITASSFSMFTSPEIGKLSAGTDKEHFDLEGYKSAADVSPIDLLNTAAALAGKTAKAAVVP